MAHATRAHCPELPTPLGTSPPLTAEDIADATEARAATYSDVSVSDVIVLDGFGVHVGVRRSCLELSDGLGDVRRVRIVTKAQAGREVRRILVLGTGAITTEAMRLCDDRRLPLVVARPGSAQPYMVGVPTLYDHGGIRRAQALAPYTAIGIEIARWLLDKRLAEQARIAHRLLGREDEAAIIEKHRSALGSCKTIGDAFTAEAVAAVGYWSAWQDVRVQFAPRDARRIPPHWCEFRGRRSPLSTEGPTATNRHAGDVINGLLNFGYWVCQSEAQIALLSMGLDPSMGFAHTSDQNRPAAALDVMEAGRALVEEGVLRLARERVWRKASFVETRTGEVRLATALAHELASVLSPALREVLGPVAEELATRLKPLVDGRARINVPTALSRSRHGRTRQREVMDFVPMCRGCGRPLPMVKPDKRRTWCDACLPEARRLGDLHEIGPARRHQRPRTKPYADNADAARAEAMRKRNAERRAWEEAHKGMALPDPAEFDSIREGLARFSVVEVAQAIGVSKSMGRQIRSGALVPHIRHWSALARLVGGTAGRGTSDQGEDVIP